MACHQGPEVAQLADLFSLIGDPTRLRIVLCCLHGPRCVSDIAGDLDQSQPLVSHHLRLLRAARLLRKERRGRQVYYELQDNHVRQMLQDMLDHVREEAAA